MSKGILNIVLIFTLLTAPVASVTAHGDVGGNTQETKVNEILSSTTAYQDSADPSPSMTVDAPETVTVGESFDIVAEGTNSGGDAGEFSTITISSPDLSSGTDFENPSSGLGDVSTFDPGDDIYTRSGSQISAEYPLVEAGTTSGAIWASDEEHELSTTVTPDEDGTYTFYVRTTLTDDTNTDEKFVAPSNPDTYDQQNFGVKKVEVEVEPQTEEYDLSTYADGNGEIAIDGNEYDDSGTYEDGAYVDLSAEPDSGYTFTGWEGDVDAADSDDSSITVEMDQDRSITATFERETEEYDLDINAESGGGLKISPPGLSTQSSYTNSYQEGTEVELTATPSSGYTFTGWESDISGIDTTEKSIVLTVDRASELTATFEKDGPKAQIIGITKPGEKYQPGDTVVLKTRVRNTAQSTQTFSVSQSLTNGGVGDAIKSKQVTIGSGESTQVRFEYTLPNIEDDNYRARIEVRNAGKEPPGNIITWSSSDWTIEVTNAKAELEGVVRINNVPGNGVTVSLPNENISKTTGPAGHFDFDQKISPGTKVIEIKIEGKTVAYRTIPIESGDNSVRIDPAPVVGFGFENSEFTTGLRCGAGCYKGGKEGHQSIEYLSGWFLSGTVYYGELRDLSYSTVSGDEVGTSLTLIALGADVIAPGDASAVAKFAKNADNAQLRKLSKLLGHLPAPRSVRKKLLDSAYDRAATQLTKKYKIPESAVIKASKSGTRLSKFRTQIKNSLEKFSSIQSKKISKDLDSDDVETVFVDKNNNPVILLDTNKWKDTTNAYKYGPGYGHIVKRHVPDSASKNGNWPVSPKSARVSKAPDTFPKDMTDKELKSLLRTAIRNGNAKNDNIIYNGDKLDKHGIDKPLKIVVDDETGVLVTAYPSSSVKKNPNSPSIQKPMSAQSAQPWKDANNSPQPVGRA